jgi:hypothetical protein
MDPKGSAVHSLRTAALEYYVIGYCEIQTSPIGHFNIFSVAHRDFFVSLSSQSIYRMHRFYYGILRNAFLLEHFCFIDMLNRYANNMLDH